MRNIQKKKKSHLIFLINHCNHYCESLVPPEMIKIAIYINNCILADVLDVYILKYLHKLAYLVIKKCKTIILRKVTEVKEFNEQISVDQR